MDKFILGQVKLRSMLFPSSSFSTCVFFYLATMNNSCSILDRMFGYSNQNIKASPSLQVSRLKISIFWGWKATFLPFVLDTCQSNQVKFVARRALLIDGSTNPPVSNANVSLYRLSTKNDVESTVDIDGQNRWFSYRHHSPMLMANIISVHYPIRIRTKLFYIKLVTFLRVNQIRNSILIRKN